MNREKGFSDEFLNAFVDDQLALEEKGRAYAELNQDEAMAQAVCELRKLHDLVQLSYKNPVMPKHGLSSLGPSRWFRRGHESGLKAAAAFALVVSIVLGWAVREPARGPAIVSLPNSIQLAQAEAQVKVLVHFNQTGVDRMHQVLNEVESLLKLYQQNGQIARIEVIANGDGLDLLRTDIAAVATAHERIVRMQKEYDNLTFLACQNTIDRLKRDTGITARLLPGVGVIDSGVAQLMRRQHQGWVYIQA